MFCPNCGSRCRVVLSVTLGGAKISDVLRGGSSLACGGVAAKPVVGAPSFVEIVAGAERCL